MMNSVDARQQPKFIHAFAEVRRDLWANAAAVPLLHEFGKRDEDEHNPAIAVLCRIDADRPR
jgi:hypothetical protein